MLAVNPALGQCPNDSPKDLVVANQDPVYLNICHSLPPTGSCPTPSSPTLLSGGSEAQEAVFRATQSAGRTDDEIIWQIAYKEASGTWSDLWLGGSWTSTAGAPYDPNETIDFGVPGLIPNTEHRARVAFCNSSNCTCWSAWAGNVTTNGFSTEGPTPPTAVIDNPVEQLVEDTFSRPVTTRSCEEADGTRGAGLGPAFTWVDCEDTSPNQNVTIGEFCDGATPANCEGSAYATPSSVARYLGDSADHHHSYADLKVYREDPTQSFQATNLQIEAYLQPVIESGTTVDKTYATKFSHEIRDCADNPTMFLVRLPDEYSYAACGQGVPPSMAASGSNETVAFTCADEPPFLINDGTLVGVSKPVWFRVEVHNDDNELGSPPLIKGTIAWDCPDNQAIENCAKKCQHQRHDWDPVGVRLDDDYPHKWGMSFHDVFYHVDLFRAGSEPSGGGQ